MSLKDELKIEKLEQYDRRRNLELQGVPAKTDEDVTQISLVLVNKLGVELERDIFIALRLPVRHRRG